MKRLSILLAIVIINAIAVQAQTEKEVCTGPDYQNDVYYSFANGEVSEQARNNWDIAFQTSAEGMGVMVNHGIGCLLYTYPYSKGMQWEHIDTTDMYQWPPMYNSTQEQFNGAFNQHAKAGNPFDFGWGKYQNVLKRIRGDSLLVLQTDQNIVYSIKMHLKEFKNGKNYWMLDYGDLTGNIHYTLALSGDPYLDKNFFYLELDYYQLLDREPASIDWDMMFTRYYDPQAQTIVSGVLANSTRVQLQSFDSVNQNTFYQYDTAAFTPQMDGIGYNWKTYDAVANMYTIDTNRVYFAKVKHANDSIYWKLYFTEFTGNQEGIYRFVQEDVTHVGIDEYSASALFLQLAPNPATDRIQLISDWQGPAQIHIYDMAGRLVHTQQIQGSGFTKQTIDIAQLKAGVYSLQLQTAHGQHAIQKFVKKAW